MSHHPHLTCTSLLLLATLAHAQTTLPFTLSKETTALTAPLLPDGTPNYVQAVNDYYSQGVTPANNGYVLWLDAVVGTDYNSLSPSICDRVLALTGATPPAPGTPLFLQSWLYLQSAEKMNRSRAANEGRRRDAELQTLIGTLWTEDEHPHTAAYLKAMATPLDRATEAAARDKWWFPFIPNQNNNLWEVLLPSLGQERDVANALSARATLRAKAGNFDGFLSDAIAVRRLARHTAGATIVEQLVAAAMETAACNATGTVAGSGILTADQCAALKTAMDRFAPLPPMADVIDRNGRWGQLQQLQQNALGDETLMKQIDLLPLAQSVDRTAVDWNIVLRQANKQMDEEVAILRTASFLDRQAAIKAFDQAREDRAALAATKPAPTPEPAPGESDAAFAERLENQQHLKILQPLAAGETRDAYSHRVFDALGNTLWPSLAKPDATLTAAAFRSQALQVVLAAGSYKAANNKWPEKLADLVPTYLKEIPHDPYAPATEVHLLIGERGIRIYSYGPNGIDDGGIDNRQLRADDIGSGVTDSAIP